MASVSSRGNASRKLPAWVYEAQILWAEKTAAVQHLGGLVGEQGVLGGILAVGPALELGQVTVIVALHLQVKHL